MQTSSALRTDEYCPKGEGPAKLRLTLVTASDEAYAMPLATALRSVVQANRSDHMLDVYVLSTGFSEQMRKKVYSSLPKGSVDLHWISVDVAAFAGFATSSHISKITYARLLIPYVIGEEIARVLYLDADVLVLSDLRPLWETNLDGKVIGAVLDDIVDRQLRDHKLRPDGLAHVERYFNAGVLLIDLSRWRQARISEKALEYLNAFPTSPFSDQDALNVACTGQWKELEVRWNFQNHFRTRFSEATPGQAPDIIHFVTSSKPWNACVRSTNAAFYDAFRSQTCFARGPHNKLRDAGLRIVCGIRNRFRRLVSRIDA